MLTIRQLFYYLTTAYVVLLLTGLLLGRWFWFYPIELENHLHQQQKELLSLATAIELRQQQLLATTVDYGNWSDTWRFIHQQNPDFLQHNFTASSMETLRLGTVVVIDAERNIVTTRQSSSGQETVGSSKAFYDWIQDYKNDDDLFGDKPRSNILHINGTSYLLAVSPVLHSDQQGPLAGWLLFYQPVGKHLLGAIEKIVRFRLREIPLDSPGIKEIMPVELPIHEVSKTHQRCFYNNQNDPALCLEMIHDTTNLPEFMNRGTFIVFMFIILLPALLFAILLHQLTDPIRRATNLLQRNNHDGLLRPVLFSSPLRIKELRQLRNAFNELVYTTRQQQAKLEQLSVTDRLTGIANRRAFDETLENTWRRLCRHPQNAVLVLADIDYFKAYNDHYGHQAGDEVLHKVAQALKGCARRTDEMAARFGGEEFVLVLYVDNEDDMTNIRNRISEAINSLKIPHGYSSVSQYLTISFGMSWIRNSGAWLENYRASEWLHSADAALYGAKGAGRNCSMLQVITPESPFTESPEYQQLPH